jgi:hypothetical protein
VTKVAHHHGSRHQAAWVMATHHHLKLQQQCSDKRRQHNLPALLADKLFGKQNS